MVTKKMKNEDQFQLKSNAELTIQDLVKLNNTQCFPDYPFPADKEQT